MENKLFVELLQLAIGARDYLTRLPEEDEWQVIYDESIKQSLLGIIFIGVEKLNSIIPEAKPPLSIFYEWFGEISSIENQNQLKDAAAKRIYDFFRNKGKMCCILKGQGIARLYPHPSRRQSGDIDLWVEGSRENTLEFLNENFNHMGFVVIHHVDVDIIDGVDCEVHFMPCYMYNPFVNRKLQNYFKANAKTQFANYQPEAGFAYPSNRFNSVFILTHIYKHFLNRGIGLRQIVDYYYVLSCLSCEDRKLAADDIHKVGLKKFACAVMYVLQRICGMEKDMFLFEPDSQRGKILLDEITRCGNFGHFDKRLTSIGERNFIKYNITTLLIQFRFLRYYPMDVISIPFWKAWHWCWRKWNGYI